MRARMGLLYVPCKPCVREGVRVPEDSVGGEAT
jgi:hypothetical protein